MSHNYRHLQGLKHNHLQQLQQLSMQFEKTFSSSDIALESQPDNPEAWYNRAEALANLGCNEEALTCFDKVLEIQPDDAAAWTFRGVVLIHLHRYEAALISCDKALEIQPNDPEAWMFRGAALYHLGRYKQAYASYDKALGLKNKTRWRKLLQLGGKFWRQLAIIAL